MKNKILFLLLILSTVAVNVRADESVTFTLSGPSRVILDKPFTISYQVNTNKAKDFRPSEITDFDVLAGPYTERSSSWVNGVSTASVKYTYTLLAKNTGRFTIPSGSIMVSNEKYTSNGLSIEVLPPDTPQQSAQSGNQPQQQGGASGATQQESNSSLLSGENLFVRPIVSKVKAYEQEAILVTYRLYSAQSNIVNVAPKKLPDFKGFMKNDIEQQPQLKLENYRGRNYATVDLYQTVIYPQRAGSVEIEKADFEVLVRIENTAPRRSIFESFFDNYTDVVKAVSAPKVTINVSELPANKPMSFSGAVGNFKMNSFITTQEVKAHEAVTLRITLEGTGNMRMVKTPTIKFPDSFELFDPVVNNDFRVTSAGTSGKKTIEYVVIPRYSGEFEIPSVEFSYFDLQSKSYKTLSTPVYKLDVLKGEGGSNAAPTVIDSYTGKEDVKQLGSDVRYIHTGDIKLVNEKTPLIGSLVSWLMYLIPLVIVLFIFVLLSKQIKENADIRSLKNKKANKIARKRLKSAQKLLNEGKKDQFYDEVLKSIWTYLSDKLSIPVASLTKDNVSAELRQRQVDDSLIEKLVDILNTCEFARYAPNSGQQEMGNLFEDTIQLISNLEENIKK